MINLNSSLPIYFSSLRYGNTFFSFFDLHLFFGFCHFVYLYWFEPHMVNSLVSVCCSTTALRIIFFLIILLLVFFGVFDNFTSFGITIDYYRTRSIHLSLSAKICICFSQHHAALNVADPSKDCKHISDVFMNTDSWFHIVERETHTLSILSAQTLLFTSVTMCLWNANHNDLVGMMEMTFLTGSIPI